MNNPVALCLAEKLEEAGFKLYQTNRLIYILDHDSDGMAAKYFSYIDITNSSHGWHIAVWATPLYTFTKTSQNGSTSGPLLKIEAADPEFVSKVIEVCSKLETNTERFMLESLHFTIALL